MIRLSTALVVASLACVSGHSCIAGEMPHPPGPCEHGPSRMTMGGVDPVAQTCTLAIAGQRVAQQAQEIVGLQAQVEMLKSDLAAATAAKAEPDKDKHPSASASPAKP